MKDIEEAIEESQEAEEIASEAEEGGGGGGGLPQEIFSSSTTKGAAERYLGGEAKSILREAHEAIENQDIDRLIKLGQYAETNLEDGSRDKDVVMNFIDSNITSIKGVSSAKEAEAERITDIPEGTGKWFERREEEEAEPTTELATLSDEDLMDYLDQYREEGFSKAEAIRQVVEDTGYSQAKVKELSDQMDWSGGGGGGFLTGLGGGITGFWSSLKSAFGVGGPGLEEEEARRIARKVVEEVNEDLPVQGFGEKKKEKLEKMIIAYLMRGEAVDLREISGRGLNKRDIKDYIYGKLDQRDIEYIPVYKSERGIEFGNVKTILGIVAVVLVLGFAFISGAPIDLLVIVGGVIAAGVAVSGIESDYLSLVFTPLWAITTANWVLSILAGRFTLGLVAMLGASVLTSFYMAPDSVGGGGGIGSFVSSLVGIGRGLAKEGVLLPASVEVLLVVSVLSGSVSVVSSLFLPSISGAVLTWTLLFTALMGPVSLYDFFRLEHEHEFVRGGAREVRRKAGSVPDKASRAAGNIREKAEKGGEENSEEVERENVQEEEGGGGGG